MRWIHSSMESLSTGRIPKFPVDVVVDDVKIIPRSFVLFSCVVIDYYYNVA